VFLCDVWKMDNKNGLKETVDEIDCKKMGEGD
jgi:hypothetical protein